MHNSACIQILGRGEMTDGGGEGVECQPHGEADDMCITLLAYKY